MSYIIEIEIVCQNFISPVFYPISLISELGTFKLEFQTKLIGLRCLSVGTLAAATLLLSYLVKATIHMVSFLLITGQNSKTSIHEANLCLSFLRSLFTFSPLEPFQISTKIPFYCLPSIILHNFQDRHS